MASGPADRLSEFPTARSALIQARAFICNTPTIRLEANDIHDNRASGIYLNPIGIAGTMQTIGSEDLTAGRGNKVHGNAAYGIDARGSQVIVAGNAVYGQTANNYSGINFGQRVWRR